MTQEARLRLDMVQACRALATLGINQGMAGNISTRSAGRMLITPSATPYDTMSPDDIAIMPLDCEDGSWEGPLRPSSEWRFHHEIQRSRPEIGAVVHAHPPFSTALSMTRRGIPPCHYMVALFGGDDVRCADYATFGTAALSVSVMRALQGRWACLMANHGMLVCGADLAQAMVRAVELEALAAQYHASLAFGGPVLLTPVEMDAARERFESYRPG